MSKLKSPKELILEIASHPKDTCFDLNTCFIHKGVLYDDLGNCGPSTRVQYRFRVVFSYDDYDYVEDMNEIQELTKVRG